jgi:hypothetical protein
MCSKVSTTGSLYCCPSKKKTMKLQVNVSNNWSKEPISKKRNLVDSSDHSEFRPGLDRLFFFFFFFNFRFFGF